MSQSEHANNLLMCSLEPMEPGTTFEQFPLHVTIQPWFSVPERMQGAFQNALTNTMHEQMKQPPVKIIAGEEAVFGWEHAVRVRLLASGLGRLANLHLQTSELIQRFGGTLMQRGVGDAYTPHVTYTKHGGIEAGTPFYLPGIQHVQRDRVTRKSRVMNAWAFRGVAR